MGRLVSKLGSLIAAVNGTAPPEPAADDAEGQAGGDNAAPSALERALQEAIDKHATQSGGKAGASRRPPRVRITRNSTASQGFGRRGAGRG